MIDYNYGEGDPGTGGDPTQAVTPGIQPHQDNSPYTRGYSPIYDQIADLWKQYTGSDPSWAQVGQWGTNVDQGYLSKISQSIYASPEANAFRTRPAAQPTDTTGTGTTDTGGGGGTTPPQPTTGGGGGGVGGGGATTTGGGLPSPFTNTFTPPPTLNQGGPAGIPYIPPTPTFTPPPAYTPPPSYTPGSFNAPDAFKAPSMQDVLSDPGYELPLQQGLGAISNSAAARGLWATGGTGKAFQDYAQNYAATKYNDIYNRNLNTYQTNFQNALNTYNTNELSRAGAYATNVSNQNIIPYQDAYQSATDTFKPVMQGYQMQAQAGQRQNELNYSNAYQKWLDDFNQKYNTGVYLRDTTAL